jgi:hypothetical protein
MSQPFPGFQTIQSYKMDKDEVKALQQFEIPTQFFLPCLSHSITVLFFKYFLKITSGTIRDLHKLLCASDFPRKKMFLIPHHHVFFGLTIIFQFIRCSPFFFLFFFFPDHRKLNIFILILLTMPFGIFTKEIQQTRMLSKTDLTRVTLPPKLSHL